MLEPRGRKSRVAVRMKFAANIGPPASSSLSSSSFPPPLFLLYLSFLSDSFALPLSLVYSRELSARLSLQGGDGFIDTAKQGQNARFWPPGVPFWWFSHHRTADCHRTVRVATRGGRECTGLANGPGLQVISDHCKSLQIIS